MCVSQFAIAIVLRLIFRLMVTCIHFEKSFVNIHIFVVLRMSIFLINFLLNRGLVVKGRTILGIRKRVDLLAASQSVCMYPLTLMGNNVCSNDFDFYSHEQFDYHFYFLECGRHICISIKLHYKIIPDFCVLVYFFIDIILLDGIS